MNYLLCISAILGATSVNLLNRKIQNTIRSSSLMTIIFFIILYFFKVEDDIALLLTSSFYGGSFVGMSTHNEVSHFLLLSSSILFSVLFIFLVPHLGGLGGALGVCAFLSVFLISAFKKAVFVKR